MKPYEHHGARRTKLYGIWSDMIKRCENGNHVSYRWYGAKGVKVDPQWRNSFVSFAYHMGHPKPGESLDRIDPNGDYAPGNCRWASAKEQAKNRSTQRLYTLNGVSKTLPEWAAEFGIKYRTLNSRIKRSGLAFEDAVCHPHGTTTTAGAERIRTAVAASNRRRARKE